jgi:uroporphyrinogen III methyltransferase/synthase
VAFTLGHDAIYNKLPKADTLVFYMGAAQQQKWAKRLIEEGWPEDTPVACVRNASLKDVESMHYTLNELLTTDTILPAPSLLIVGKTAKSSGAPDKKWLYTGADKRYFNMEGSVVHNPMVKIEPLDLNQKQVELFNNLQVFDRIVYATPFAVHHFFRALFAAGFDVRAISELVLTSIGQSTSEALSNYGLRVEPEVRDNSAKGLLQSLKDKNTVNETILLPCSDEGLSVLPKGLKKLRNEVYELSLYTTCIPDNVVRHNLGDFYGVVLTSPKAVHHFFELHNSLPSELKISVRGKYTKEVLDEYLCKMQLKNVSTTYNCNFEIEA